MYMLEPVIEFMPDKISGYPISYRACRLSNGHPDKLSVAVPIWYQAVPILYQDARNITGKFDNGFLHLNILSQVTRDSVVWISAALSSSTLTLMTTMPVSSLAIRIRQISMSSCGRKTRKHIGNRRHSEQWPSRVYNWSQCAQRQGQGNSSETHCGIPEIRQDRCVTVINWQ